MRPRRPERRERGLFRGCCLGIVLLLVILGSAAFIVDRAIAAPDLGGPPRGPDDGNSELAIAAALAPAAAAQLLTSGHALITLSEHDLSVIAAAHNPHPDRFRNVQARLRNGDVAVSAQTSFGPFTSTVVGYLTVTVVRTSTPAANLHLQALDVGALHIPSWLQNVLVGNFSQTLSLNGFLNALGQVRAVLTSLLPNLDCIAAAPNGLLIGIHRPGIPLNAHLCTPGSG